MDDFYNERFAPAVEKAKRVASMLPEDALAPALIERAEEAQSLKDNGGLPAQWDIDVQETK
jgi:hypothetical protein